MSYQASKDENGLWVASPGSMLTTTQRVENKIKRKLERGENLAGPFAAHPSGQAAIIAKLKEAQAGKV